MANWKRPVINYSRDVTAPRTVSYLRKMKALFSQPSDMLVKMPHDSIPKNKEYHLGNRGNKDYWIPLSSCYQHIALIGKQEAIHTMDLYLAKQSIQYGQPLIFIEHSYQPEVAPILIEYAKTANREKSVFYMNLVNQDNSEYFFNYNFDTFSASMWAELFMKTIEKSSTAFVPYLYSVVYSLLQAIKQKERTITFELCKHYFTWERVHSLATDTTLEPTTLYLINGFLTNLDKLSAPRETFTLYQQHIYQTCDIYLIHKCFKSNTLINWPRVAFNEIFSAQAPIFIVSLPQKNNMLSTTIYYFIHQMLQTYQTAQPSEQIYLGNTFPIKHIVLRHPQIELFPPVFSLAQKAGCFITSSICQDRIHWASKLTLLNYLNSHALQCYSFPLDNFNLKNLFIYYLKYYNYQKAKRAIQKYSLQLEENKANWRQNIEIYEHELFKPNNFQENNRFILLFQDNMEEIKLIPKV